MKTRKDTEKKKKVKIVNGKKVIIVDQIPQITPQCRVKYETGVALNEDAWLDRRSSL